VTGVQTCALPISNDGQRRATTGNDGRRQGDDGLGSAPD
jgi:hypothetical protein